MTQKHPSVEYTILPKSQDSSPIIKKKEITILCNTVHSKDSEGRGLLLGEVSSKKARERKKKFRFIVLGLFLIIISSLGGIYQLVKNNTEEPKNINCTNIFSQSDTEKRINEHKNIDIAFLLEWSSKNFENVDKIRTNINNLVTKVQSEFVDAKMRIAIVAYRSYLNKDGEFKINNLTTNMSQVQTFLSNLDPTDDTISNEDVLDALGAIDKSLNLDWQASNKLIFQIGVSELRDFCNVDCPEQATSYAPSELFDLFQKVSDKGLQYYLVQIDETQDLMAKEIEEIAPSFNRSDLFNIYDMKQKGLDFSAITSSVIASIKNKLMCFKTMLS